MLSSATDLLEVTHDRLADDVDGTDDSADGHGDDLDIECEERVISPWSGGY
jgi:hypothetical protein